LHTKEALGHGSEFIGMLMWKMYKLCMQWLPTFLNVFFFLKNTDDRIYRDVSAIQMDKNIPRFESIVMIEGKLYTLLSGA
jgi:hypothetical protein